MIIRLLSGCMLAGLALHEGMAARRLWEQRRDQYAAAKARAAESGRQLLVIGDPHSGAVTRLFPAAGCGDLCVDLTGCPACPAGQVMDVTQDLGELASNGAVVFVSCVLEYVPQPQKVLAESLRIAGGPENLFVVAVDPNTITSYLYPGAQSQLRDGRWVPVATGDKIAVASLVTVAVVGLAVGVHTRS